MAVNQRATGSQFPVARVGDGGRGVGGNGAEGDGGQGLGWVPTAPGIPPRGAGRGLSVPEGRRGEEQGTRAGAGGD